MNQPGSISGQARRPSKAAVSLRILLGLALGVAAVYLASREIAFRDLPEALRSVRMPWLFAALAVTFSGHLFKAFRWRILLQSQGSVIPFGRMLRYVLAGQLTNLFIPGRAGDIGRAWLIGRQGAGSAFSFGTVIVEKLLDLVVYAGLAAGLLLLIPLPVEVRLSPPVLALVAGVAAGALFIGVRYWQIVAGFVLRLLFFLPKRRQDRVAGWLEAGGNSLNVFRGSSSFSGVVFSTIGIWIISWLTNEIVLLAFGLRLPPTASLLLLIVLQAGISTNLVPGTIGLFEYLCVISLALYGVPREMALAYGVVLHALVLLPLVGGGASALFWGAQSGENNA